MDRLLTKSLEERNSWSMRLVLLVVFLGVTIYVRAQIQGSEFRVTQEVQRIHLAEDLPLPEPEKIPEFEQPETDEAVELEEMESLEDFGDEEMASLDDMLGLDGEGMAGSDAFGLAARKGGRDLLQSGGDIGCEWYASVLNDELNSLLLPLLSDNDRLLEEKWSVIVKLWLAPDGTVEDFDVASTGDRELDMNIESVMADLKRVRTPPPPDMPNPVRLRLRCQV